MIRLLALTSLLLAICSGTCFESNQRGSFQDYVAQIPVRPTPLVFSFYEGHPDGVDMSGLDSGLVRRFFPPHMYHLGGRLFPEKRFVSLLYSVPGDVICESIFTYTSDGLPIDTADITGEYVVDAGVEARSTSRIHSNGLISIDDTLQTVQLNENDEPIPGTEKSTYRQVMLQLNDSGKFVRLDSTGRVLRD